MLKNFRKEGGGKIAEKEKMDRIITKEDKKKYFTREGAQNNSESACYKCTARDCDKECPVSNPDGILGLKLKISILQDKLSRRNMQIKDLKVEIHKKQIEINQLYRDIEKAKKY